MVQPLRAGTARAPPCLWAVWQSVAIHRSGKCEQKSTGAGCFDKVSDKVSIGGHSQAIGPLTCPVTKATFPPMPALDFRYDQGGLYFPRLGLWLDPHLPQSGPARVFISHAHADHIAVHR